MRDPESRQHLPARRGIRSNVPPQICAAAPASKASEVIAAGPSLGLEEANPAVALLMCSGEDAKSNQFSEFVRATALSRFLRSCYDKPVARFPVISYWRFMGGSDRIRIISGHLGQSVQHMQIVQSRINTADFASC